MTTTTEPQPTTITHSQIAGELTKILTELERLPQKSRQIQHVITRVSLLKNQLESQGEVSDVTV